jgi:choline-sulfatase
MSRSNVLLIQSDQHNPRIMGVSGDDNIQTPAMDALAARGTRFENAYCPSPICVPSRASLATGRYAHETRNWDNASPYVGTEADSWAHRVRDAGQKVTTVGKLHFRAEGDPTGFDDQRLVMHVLDGTGDLYPLLRGKAEPKEASRLIVDIAGPGESEYTRYDRDIADEASRWLQEESARYPDGWVLYVSFVCPHFPLIVPQEYFDLYDNDDLPMPVNWQIDEWSHHRADDTLRRLENLDKPFTEEAVRRAVTAYRGMVTFVDAQIGRVLDALEMSGHVEDTTVLYTSDHGDMVGQHGLWSKHTMYEPSVGVPMIVAGPNVPAAKVSSTNVSLVDIFPTVLHATGAPSTAADDTLPGDSLVELANAEDSDRAVFSEYHANYSSHASYMLKDGDDKLIYHVDAPAQLFNLVSDPHEVHDLAADQPDRAAEMEKKLREIIDPEEGDRQAKLDGQAKIAAAGGADAIVGKGLRVPYSPPPSIEPYDMERATR